MPRKLIALPSLAVEFRCEQDAEPDNKLLFLDVADKFHADHRDTRLSIALQAEQHSHSFFIS